MAGSGRGTAVRLKVGGVGIPPPQPEGRERERDRNAVTGTDMTCGAFIERSVMYVGVADSKCQRPLETDMHVCMYMRDLKIQSQYMMYMNVGFPP